MGYRAPQVLARALTVYSAAGWDVFVHIDAKADLAGYRNAVGESADDCCFVDSVEVFWGGYSMLEAEFKLIDAARAAGPYDKYLLITDDTLPLFPPAWLNAVLGQERDLVCAMGQPEGSKNDLNYKKLFFYDHPATMIRGHGSRSTEIDERFLHAMQEISALRAFGKKKIKVAWGSAYWALSAATIELLMDTVYDDPHLAKSFAYSPQPDETMIQSILRCYLYKKDRDLSPMYADFHSQIGGPRILDSVATLPFDLQDHQVFVRKVQPTAVRFAEVVVSRLAQGLTAWGTTPETAHHSESIIDEDGCKLAISTMRLSAPSVDKAVVGWNGIEMYSDRPYRWTASDRIEWRLDFPDLPPGRIRFFLPTLLSRPGMFENSQLLLGSQAKVLRSTRHSLIAEFDHEGLSAGTSVTLITPPPIAAYPPHDNRLVGIGIAIDRAPPKPIDCTLLSD